MNTVIENLQKVIFHFRNQFIQFDYLDTAERHIPLCKNIINRPKPPRKNSQLLEKNGGESTPKVMEIKKL